MKAPSDHPVVNSHQAADEMTRDVLQSKAHDEALDFLEKHRNDVNARIGLDDTYMRKLRRKIDYHILPFMLLVYILNFIDKTILNVSLISHQFNQLSLIKCTVQQRHGPIQRSSSSGQ